MYTAYAFSLFYDFVSEIERLIFTFELAGFRPSTIKRNFSHQFTFRKQQKTNKHTHTVFGYFSGVSILGIIQLDC